MDLIKYLRKHYLIFLLGVVITFPSIVFAIPFELDKLKGSLDTTMSYGLQWRVQGRDQDLIGIANGGNAFSVDGDDGDLNYAKGLVANVVKVTHDLGLNYENYGAFIRGSYFYDFYNVNKDELSSDAQDTAGRGIDLLDAYIRGQYNISSSKLDIRIGQQVINWGESAFILNGLNVVNTFDVSKIRIPGAEIREALLPTPMLKASVQFDNRISLEGFYLTRFDRVKTDICGTYFSTSDVICEKHSGNIIGGFGFVDQNIPGFGVPLQAAREADNNGQFGLALHYLSKSFNNTELGFYYTNYHSRLPILSAVATGGVPEAFVEYPENIHLFGASFNTELGSSGISLQGEYSHRTNLPLQIEGSEVFSAAQFSPLSQLGPALVPGMEISGYRRHEVGQLQFLATKSFGPENPFWADEWLVMGEVGATDVYDLESSSKLRYEAPGTDLPGDPTLQLLGLSPGTQKGGWADKFSYGYVITTQLTYNQAIGSINLLPHLAFSHDVDGTTPGPAATFLEDRKAITLGLQGDYLLSWSADLSYTSYFGAGSRNAINDRDFIAMNLKYSF